MRIETSNAEKHKICTRTCKSLSDTPLVRDFVRGERVPLARDRRPPPHDLLPRCGGLEQLVDVVGEVVVDLAEGVVGLADHAGVAEEFRVVAGADEGYPVSWMGLGRVT